MHDRLVSRCIDALHQCFLVYIFPGIVIVVPSLLTLVLTLDVYDSHINSRTIDLY